MYKGMKPKRKSSSFITRLMGRDRWQTQGHVDRNQKGLSDSYLQNNGPIGIQENNPRGSHRNHAIVLEPSNTDKYEGNAKILISKRDFSCKRLFSHLERKDGLLLDPNYRHRAHTSNFQLEQKNAEVMSASGICLLKPNLKNMQTSGSGHDVPADKNRRTTRRLRNAYAKSSHTKTSLLKGYDGDESSFDAQESDSDCEQEMLVLPSRDSFWSRKKWSRYPSSGLVEGVNRKANRKPSEKWRITEKYQDLEIVLRESTSGGLFSSPGGSKAPTPLTARPSFGILNSQLGSNRGSVMLEDLSRIRSIDGWKVKNQETSARSSSLPPVASRSNREGTYHDSLAEKNNLLCGETTRYCRRKAEKGNMCFSENAHDTKSRSAKRVPCQHRETLYFSAQAEFELQMEANVKNIAGHHFMFHFDAKDDGCGSTGSNIVVSEHESTTLSFKSFPLDSEQSSGRDEDKAAICDEDDSCLQEPLAAPPEKATSSQPPKPATECSKEAADRTSPVSVLNVPFEDASSFSESFNRINAAFHELRMQLQHLNMDSITCPEELALHSLEKVIFHLLLILSEGSDTFDPEGWEVSYLLDVLIHSGLQESGFDILRLTWHSPNSPLNPRTFNDLERKYSNTTSGSIPERNLLFHQINLTLLDIFHHQIDWFPWVAAPGLARVRKKGPVWNGFERMAKQECADMNVAERMMDREMQWTDYRGEMDITGKKIEILLIDEMIDDFLVSLLWDQINYD
ncbi:uncharacterized protein LOC127239536 isoform X2 [Andrographis paniculata]|nr:uncharacterized protein LOC127239536 isoform X2 [Andrographis paniculata]